MKNHNSLILLFSSWFVLHASSLYLGDGRHPRLEQLSERTDDNSIGSLEVDLSEHIEGTGRRENGIGKHVPLAGKQQSFVKCVFEFNGSNKPEYSCDHSQDVKIKWHEEKGRLMGTFTMSFHCPKQRSVTNEIQSPRNNAVQKWSQLIREKRRTFYRDDAVEEDVKNEAAEETAEETAEEETPEETPEVLAEENIVEEPQVARPPDAEEKITAEEEKVPPVSEVENSEGEDKGQKEVNEDDAASMGGSSVDKEIPGAGEDAGEMEKEVIAVEKEEDQAADVIDKEVPAQEASQGDEGEKIESSTSTDDKNGTTTDETTEDEEKDDDKEMNHGVAIILDIDLGDNVTAEQVEAFLNDVEAMIHEAGDYIISLLLRNLKRRLNGARINERFDAKVEKLAKSHGGDSGKALRIMTKRIHNNLGKSYEIEIIKLLKELRDGMKL